ncbi:MAG: hypothetical protein ACRD5F_03780 [Candidatus Acidiferrales bacterium]
MNQAENHQGPVAPQGGEKPKPVIHRVCIQCNNMFTVTADNFEAKHCPTCHKG